MIENQFNKIENCLKAQRYLGRGIFIGKTPTTQKAVVAYFISGRSQNSQNRIFVKSRDGLDIMLFDESKIEDTSLILYSPMRILKQHIIVTNGDQTETICDYISKGKTLEEALNTRTFEPDKPNYTPRISGLIDFATDTFTYKLSILKNSDGLGRACTRQIFCYESCNGIGHFIHTYSGDGNPIPSFIGEPKQVASIDDIDSFTNSIWKNLDSTYKIALAVYYIDLKSKEIEHRIINKKS